MGILSIQKKATSNPLPQEEVDYTFTELVIGEDVLSAIKIIDGSYSGVVYYYGRVKVIPPEIPETPAILSFDYRVHSLPDGMDHRAVKGDDFKQRAGDILTAILLDNGKGEYATIREHDSKEPHL